MYFDRNVVAESLLAQIRTTGILCGDHQAPKEGGWSGGTPGSGKYVGYTTLFIMQTPISPSSFCAHCYDVTVNFQTRTFGTTRAQSEGLSVTVREVLNGHQPAPFTGWKPQAVLFQSMGPIERMDDTDPKGWRVSDSYSLLCLATIGSKAAL